MPLWTCQLTADDLTEVRNISGIKDLMRMVYSTNDQREYLCIQYVCRALSETVPHLSVVYIVMDHNIIISKEDELKTEERKKKQNTKNKRFTKYIKQQTHSFVLKITQQFLMKNYI